MFRCGGHCMDAPPCRLAAGKSAYGRCCNGALSQQCVSHWRDVAGQIAYHGETILRDGLRKLAGNGASRGQVSKSGPSVKCQYFCIIGKCSFGYAISLNVRVASSLQWWRRFPSRCSRCRALRFPKFLGQLLAMQRQLLHRRIRLTTIHARPTPRRSTKATVAVIAALGSRLASMTAAPPSSLTIGLAATSSRLRCLTRPSLPTNRLGNASSPDRRQSLSSMAPVFTPRRTATESRSSP